MLRFVILFLALVAAVLFAFQAKRTNDQIAALEEKVETAQADADAALSTIISPDLLREVDKSVYMVRVDKFNMGSAFVIDRDRGILATAAHVVEAIEFIEQFELSDFSVINQFTGKPLPVQSGRMHTGYGEFQKLVKRYGPIAPDSFISLPRAQPYPDLPHDTALLLVDPIDPETGENILGPSLKIASMEKLLALKAGDAAAVLGFPGNVINSATQGESASSRISRGIITALIAPIDQIEEKDNGRMNNLIVHRIGLAGGNSGGPLINNVGEVIGINTHGVSSNQSQGDGIAQRADVLLEMMEPLLEEETVTREFIPEWERRLERYLKAEDALPSLAIWRHARFDGKQKRDIRLSELDISEGPKFTSDVFRPTFSHLGRLILPARDLESTIPKPDSKSDKEADSKKSRSSSRISAETMKAFEFSKIGEYATFPAILSEKKNNAFIAFDYALNSASRGACRLEIYHRRYGETEFRPIARGYIASAKIRSAKTPNPLHEFVIHRPLTCSNQQEFLFAIVSWDKEEKNDNPTTATSELAVNNTHSAASSLPSDWSELKEKSSNFIDCRVPVIGNNKICMKTVHLEDIAISDFNVENSAADAQDVAEVE